MKLPDKVYPYLAFWVALNLIQAFFSELIHDEAYYWFYSKKLAWGYFDHPPAIAFLIKIGDTLIHNELGVRLAIVFMSAATLWLIWKTINAPKSPRGSKEPALFFGLVFSTVIIHIGGFIAVPDIPLVFFTALYFYFFKQYLEKNNWQTALLLTLAVVGMAYSKYQGALVVIFSVLPNLKLLRRPSFWMVPILTLLAYIPHFQWQLAHEFPTFRYQFLDRSNVPYKIEFFFNYILGQILIFGPLIGFLLFPAAVKYRAKNDFEKTMKWCFYGFFGFFLLQSTRGRIEPNWTVMAAVPMFYMGYHYIVNNKKLKKRAYKLMLPSFVLILIFRIYMMVGFLPAGLVKRDEFHGWKHWAETISEKAGDLPVVFHNTFQMPSKYMFYSGKFAHSANTVNYAGKEYDLRPDMEEKIQGKKVFNIHGGGKDTLDTGSTGLIKYDIVPGFYYYNRIKLRIPKQTYKVPLDTVLEIPIKIENPTDKEVDFSKTPTNELSIQYCLFWYGKVKYCKPAMQGFPVGKLAAGESVDTKAKIYTPPEKGKHWRFRLAIKAKNFYGRNSNSTLYKIID
ncbi:MAG TPA: glycosyltransferase family 39 protein [Bacteroidetes bacterium]|nr:glycosyltransferase family 39 protein [Bacteroidota bacterium]